MRRSLSNKVTVFCKAQKSPVDNAILTGLEDVFLPSEEQALQILRGINETVPKD